MFFAVLQNDSVTARCALRTNDEGRCGGQGEETLPLTSAQVNEPLGPLRIKERISLLVNSVF